MKTLITIIAALLAVPFTAHAQSVNFGAVDDGTNVATISAGAENGLAVGAGYARGVTVADRPVVLGGELSLQWAEVDIDDFRLRAGAFMPIVGRGPWKLIGGLSGIVRGTKNEASRMINVGADAALLAGRYSSRWFAAAELGFDWALATHVEHSDAYRMQVHADARDGWYGNPGGVVRAGLQTGISFGGNDVILRAGRMVDTGGEPTMFPFYGTLTYDRRW